MLVMCRFMLKPDLLYLPCGDRGGELCVETEEGGKRCVWSGEAFLCVLLAARVLLPSLVGVISSGNSLMAHFGDGFFFF